MYAVGEKEPKVSIVIPVFNGANFLRSAIDSACAQTHTNTEIIVVNDGSADGGQTESIARDYRDRIQYISQANTGVGGALNTGIRSMTGDFFTWLSHDDLFMPQKIERNLAYYRELGLRQAIIFSDYTLIDELDNEIYGSKLPFETYLHRPMLPLFDGAINGNSLFIPKSVFLAAGLFDPNLRYTQDYHLWHTMLRDFEFFLQPERLVKHRIHPNQDSQKSDILPEGNALWGRIIKDRNEVERVQLQGSSQRFYSSMHTFLTNTLYDTAAAQADRLKREAANSTSISFLIFVADDIEAAVATTQSIISEGLENYDIVIIPLGRFENGGAVLAHFPHTTRIGVMPAAHLASIRNGLPMVCIAKGDYISITMPGCDYRPGTMRRQIETFQEVGRTISCSVAQQSIGCPKHSQPKVEGIVLHRILQRVVATLIRLDLWQINVADVNILANVDEASPIIIDVNDDIARSHRQYNLPENVPRT